MITITNIVSKDIRFKTSTTLEGSDAVHYDPDYSAAYVILKTDHVDGLEGHGLTFTIGRGNELCVAAINSLSHLVIGKSLHSLTSDMRCFWKTLTNDSQLRWIGPEKGVIHLATAAIVNAVWDLWAKNESKPVWKLVADMSSEQIISCIDFTYIDDVITPIEALNLLNELRDSRNSRIDYLLQNGYPSYTTSPGWLGYSDEKIKTLCKEALDKGWTCIKMKVGSNIDDDMRRAKIVRSVIGDSCKLMMDANQIWNVPDAIENMKKLSCYNPWWIEEPTSPDDILGHGAIAKAIHPIKIATGEHCHNRIMFKQFFQLKAIDICQIDSCRLGGLNEVLSVLLMAAKFKIPVCPHGGGVGLCEYVQHIAMIDYIVVSGQLENRMLEYSSSLHEHFVDSIKINNGNYMPPLAPGFSITMKSESLDKYLHV